MKQCLLQHETGAALSQIVFGFSAILTHAMPCNPGGSGGVRCSSYARVKHLGTVYSGARWAKLYRNFNA